MVIAPERGRTRPVEKNVHVDQVAEGRCRCGCGRRTPLATRTDRAGGRVKGQPMLYVKGHNRRAATRMQIQPGPLSTPCHVMLVNVQSTGYAREYVDRKPTLAHRVAYVRMHGPIPDGLQIDHLCRNRACVNPEHLEAVTSAENTRRGATAVLTAEQVAEMRMLFKERGASRYALAGRFGVAHSTVCNILSGRRWAAA